MKKKKITITEVIANITSVIVAIIAVLDFIFK